MKNLKIDNLETTAWLGQVVDIDDPQQMGRVKVRVFGKFDDLAVEDIPWAYPRNNVSGGSSTGGGFFSVPKLDSIVAINFDNGNIYHPEYSYVQKISDEVRQELKTSYINSHILIYDTVTDGALKLFFTEEKGLMFDYKSTQINIKPNKSITIQTASTDSKVEIDDNGNITITEKNNITINCQNAKISASSSIYLDCNKFASIKLGSSVTDQIIKGNVFQAYFNTHTHIGNLGAPTSPPVIPSTPDHLSTVVKTQ